MGIYIMVWAAIVFTVLLFLLKKGIDIFFIANVFGLAGLLSIAGCIYYSDGQASPVLPWLATTPIVILLLAGKKSGILWAIIAIITISLFTILGSLGYIFPKAFTKENLAFNLSCNAGLVLLIFFISLVYENVRIRAHDIIASKNNELQKTLNELNDTQSQLIQSEKMASLGELTAGIAHEIQNPLNFINNFSEINADLIDETLKELEQNNMEEVFAILNDIKSNSQRIQQHGGRADSIVKSMLQHSRKSTGQKELTDINTMCDECLRLSFHGLRAKDKSFNSDFKIYTDKDAGKINVVPQDISRVLVNLLNNAFYSVEEKKKNTEAGFNPVVSITTKKILTSEGKNLLEIIISDNGTGIPKNIMDKIFQPFFTTKPTGQGTGLGLSLSFDIIKSHKGTIDVDTHEGEGTKFIIHLPYQ
ncbi:MAG: histidine kinase [Bacteroidetes bacterium]|nr:histidine kinase [Bacteroidota bacterium]